MGRNYYIGYPYSTFGAVSDFVLKKIGKEEIRFNLKEELYALDISYTARKIINQYSFVECEPSFDGRFLHLPCISKGENVILVIDMKGNHGISISHGSN